MSNLAEGLRRSPPADLPPGLATQPTETLLRSLQPTAAATCRRRPTRRMKYCRNADTRDRATRDVNIYDGGAAERPSM